MAKNRLHSNFLQHDGNAMLEKPRCPYLRRRRCLFGHSSEEVASSSSVGARGSTQQGDSADAPVPQMMEEIEEMIRSVRQELIVKEVIDVLVPQVQDALALRAAASG